MPNREVLLALVARERSQPCVELELVGGARQLRRRDRRQATEEVRADQPTAGGRDESLREWQGRKSCGRAVVERFRQQRKVIAGVGLDHFDESGVQAPGCCVRHRRACGLG